MESRCALRLCGVGKESVVVLCILIIREIANSILESELSGPDVIADRVETTLRFVYCRLTDTRFQKDMPAVDAVTTAVDELNDMVAEFRLNYLRHAS